MGQISNIILQDLLDHIFTASAYTPPASLYLSLHTSDPGETGANEATYTNYTGAIRKAVVFSTAAAARAITHNNTQLVFPMNGGSSQSVTHFGIWTSSTVGVGIYIAGGVLQSELLVTGGNIPKVNGAELTISVSAGTTVGVSNYLANKLLDFLFRNQVFIRPTIQFGLFTTNCSDSSPGTECPGANYTRKAVSVWDAAVLGSGTAYTANTNEELFASPSDTSWGTVVATAIFDSVTTEMLFYGNDVVDLAIATGVAVKIEAGAVLVTLS